MTLQELQRSNSYIEFANETIYSIGFWQELNASLIEDRMELLNPFTYGELIQNYREFLSQNGMEDKCLLEEIDDLEVMYMLRGEINNFF